MSLDSDPVLTSILESSIGTAPRTEAILPSIFAVTREELTDELGLLGREGSHRRMSGDGGNTSKADAMRARQIFAWLYQRQVTGWEQMSDLGKDLRRNLASRYTIEGLERVSLRQSLDGTAKALWKLTDGKTVESVIIPAAETSTGRSPNPALQNSGDSPAKPAQTRTVFAGEPSDEALDSENWNRLTACISSQVGCAMKCGFCLTGTQGLERHLRADEIVRQVWELRRLAPITNIVFMGMGEPLHNLQNVIQACKILIDPMGFQFSRRRVTVSTSGLVPAIEELGKSVPVSLAVSLNATTDEQRDQIMPVNRKWNIRALLDACARYPLGSHRRITFEYVMLRDFNDSLEDARRLPKLLDGIPAKINLIPFNEHSGSEFKRPADSRVKEFQNELLRRGMTATVRISRGRDILAACGQLKSKMDQKKDAGIVRVSATSAG